MMNGLRRILLGAALPLLLCAQGAFAEEKITAFIPAEAEFAATLNVAPVIDSGFLQKVLNEAGGEKGTAQLSIFKDLTGIDVMNKDLKKIHIMGQLGHDETTAICFEGRFDQSRLVNLIKANDQFKDLTVGGKPAYTWFDNGEKKAKFGAFLAEDMALIANSEKALNAVLASNPAVGNPLRDQFSKLAAGAKPESSFWCVLTVPERVDFMKFPAAREVKSFSGVIDLTAQDVTTTINATLSKADNSQQWLDIVEGGLGLVSLQQEKPSLAELARGTKVEMGSDKMTITARVKADEALIRRIMADVKKK